MIKQSETDICELFYFFLTAWFISVQVMVSASLLIIFLISVTLTLNVFQLFPKHMDYAVYLGSAVGMALCSELCFFFFSDVCVSCFVFIKLTPNVWIHLEVGIIVNETDHLVS